jgi:4'-phosphopantetheinyl transferase
MFSTSSWNLPPGTLTLGSDEIHVWRASLDRPLSQVRLLLHTLSPDEQGRAERFHFQRDRERFIVARGVLRTILGRYLRTAPEQLSFRYSPYGKPALAPEFSGEMIHFNVSHSHGLALYAFTRGREVGIDLERLRPNVEEEQIAKRFFSPREIAMLRALPRDLRQHAFFLCWTRKEAYIKATGKGLSLPLDQFAVSLTPGHPAALLYTQADPHAALGWSLQDLTPAPDYAAALAVEGHGWSLACWQWPE